MSVKKRPELVELPEVPTVLKISEMPTGVYILRINLPFTLTHLARVGVKKCFIVSRSRKSIGAMLGEDFAEIEDLQRIIKKKVKEKYPLLQKHVYVTVGATIGFGYGQTRGTRGGKPAASTYHYVGDVQKLVGNLEECGFSAMPLQAFMMPIGMPRTWVNFVKKVNLGGFIASQFGRRLYDELSISELNELIRNNDILQKMNAFVCQTQVATGKWMTCPVPKKT